MRRRPDGRRETAERSLEVQHRKQAEPHAEDAGLVAEPGAVGDPYTLAGQDLIEAADGDVTEDRRFQAHAADRPAIRPNPIDKPLMLHHPVRESRETFREAPAPF